MNKNILITPAGMKDMLSGECNFLRILGNSFYKIAKDRGYSEIQTPMFEFFDVIDRPSIKFPLGELYKFTDAKGRLLVLRPDNTIPIARCAATRLRGEDLPLRLFYAQNVFKSNSAYEGKRDCVYQAGVELIGLKGKDADIEIIDTAVDFLNACNTDFIFEMGHIGVFKELMALFPVSDIIKENIRELTETKNYPALGDLLDELEKNISEKKVIKALRELPKLFGGKEVFAQAREVFSGFSNAIFNVLEFLEELFKETAEKNPKNKILIDLAMVSRIDYYTGVIIKGYWAGYGAEVLSGGRYDNLLSEFGRDAPAIGFGADLDAIVKADGFYSD